MCVLSVSPWLQVPKGSISRLHLFEGFLIWGLGQPQSAVPSSIIPAEEQRGGEEGAERRKRTGGDGVISYLSSLSPHRRWLPLPPALSHSVTPASPYLSPTLFHHLSCLLFSSLSSFYAHLHSEHQPVVPSSPLSVCLFVCLSDCLTSALTVVPFVSANKWGWPFIVKQTPMGSDETTSV